MYSTMISCYATSALPLCHRRRTKSATQLCCAIIILRLVVCKLYKAFLTHYIQCKNGTLALQYSYSFVVGDRFDISKPDCSVINPISSVDGNDDTVKTTNPTWTDIKSSCWMMVGDNVFGV